MNFLPIFLTLSDKLKSFGLLSYVDEYGQTYGLFVIRFQKNIKTKYKTGDIQKQFNIHIFFDINFEWTWTVK